jgi:hypothetical protein
MTFKERVSLHKGQIHSRVEGIMCLRSMGQNAPLYVSSGPGDDEFLIGSFTSYNVKHVSQTRAVEKPHLSQQNFVTGVLRITGIRLDTISPAFSCDKASFNMNLAYFSMIIGEPYSSCHSSCPWAPLGMIKQHSSPLCNEKDRSRRLLSLNPIKHFLLTLTGYWP